MKINNALLFAGMLAASGIAAQNNNGSATTTTTTTSSSATVTSTPSPTIVSKKGEVYLPEAGDWALCMDATPWISYFGNLIHGPANSATNSFLNSNQTFVGKYYINATTAYRFLLRIGINSTTQTQEIASSDTGSAFPTPQVEDKRTISNHFIGVGFGIEKRRGKTRLQGYYGVEGMIYLAGSDTTFTYGNGYNANSNSSPAWWDWSSGTTVNGLPRITQDEPGTTFGISVLGFIGIEYFIAPKISIGGEFTWGITFQTTGEGSYNREELNPASGLDQTDTYKSTGNSSFSLDNGWNQAFGSGNASLYINFHF